LRRSHLILAILGVILLLFALLFALNAAEIRREWFLRFGMHEAAPGVRVRDGLPAERERAFADLAVAGRARAEAWFGPLRNRATLVFVHDQALKRSVGILQPFAWNPYQEGNRRVYIGPKGLSVDLVAHGIAHAEIKQRLGLDLWPGLPAWFDEGVATQCDQRPFLQPDALGAPDVADAAALASLVAHEAFTGDQGESNLAIAKREVSRWLRAAGGRPAVDALLEALRGGESFDSAYARLESARKAG